MIIKKFQAKTEAEAVEIAKKELGENIVVMNVKNVKKKGLFAFLKPQMIEVTVALEEEQAKYREKKPENPEEFMDSSGAVRPQPVLISLNKKYKPIVVQPYNRFQIVGRVL